MAPSLEVFVPDALWLREYFVRLGGARFNARMTVIKLRSGEVLIHSPCACDDSLIAELAALGRVARSSPQETCTGCTFARASKHSPTR